MSFKKKILNVFLLFLNFKNFGSNLATFVAFLGVIEWDPIERGSQYDIDLHQWNSREG